MKKISIGKILTYLVLTIGALIMIFPFYWMIATTLKTSAEYASYPPVWAPSNWLNFENFVAAFKAAPMATYFKNSVVVTVISVAINSFTTICAAFAFSRLKFKRILICLFIEFYDGAF